MTGKVEAGKLIVTSRTLYGGRRTVSALKSAVPGARIRGAGLMGIFVLEAESNALELSSKINWECGRAIGRAVAVLAEVPSLLEPIRKAVVRIGAEQIGAEETFCFRLNKRGSHGLERDTPEIEYEVGGAIWVVLRRKCGKRPLVDLKNPDVTVIAEALGFRATDGILRRAWRTP